MAHPPAFHCIIHGGRDVAYDVFLQLLVDRFMSSVGDWNRPPFFAPSRFVI